MKRTTLCTTILLVLLFTASIALAQNIPIEKANYKLAERFSPNKLKKMAFTASVDPHWLKLSERFWYTYETPDGKTFYIVNPARRTKKPIFDNVKMAAELTLLTPMMPSIFPSRKSNS